MNANHIARRVLITGKSGSGKSTKFFDLIQESRPRYLFAFDPKRELAGRMKLRECVNLAEMKSAVLAEKPVLFDPHAIYVPGEFVEAFNFFCALVVEFARVLPGKKLFAVDEIQKFTRPGAGGIPRALAEIMDDGRKDQLDTIFVVNKGLNKLNEEIRGQLTEAFVFKSEGSLSLKWLRAECGIEPAEIEGLTMPARGKAPTFIHKRL
jgi:hypothetical protein